MNIHGLTKFLKDLFSVCAMFAFFLSLILIFILIFALTSHDVVPTANRESWEDTLISTQLDRAKSQEGNAQIVITGDSSSLMGLDASEMQRQLGVGVQSFATMGFVGPEGYAAIVQKYSTRSDRIKLLIIQMQRLTFSDGDDNYATGYEDLVLERRREKNINFLALVQDYGYAEIVKKVIDFPLKGQYGRYYGMPSQIRDTLYRHNGTMVDPRQTDDVTKPRVYDCRISEQFYKRLLLMRERLKNIGAERTILVITPLPKGNALNYDSYFVQCNDSFAKITSVLDLNMKDLVTFEDFDPSYFASYSHLNSDGRNLLTKSLVDYIKKRSLHIYNNTD